MHRLKSDHILFAIIVICVLFINMLSLDNNCYWGDDFAAYISEGISIADGYFDEQAKLNVLMHPSPLPDEALNGYLVYVWGYPLLLALVYAFAGFDRSGFTSVIYYKYPSAIALALLAGILYLFLRRRMGKALSFTLSFLFCLCYEFRVSINSLYSDLVFLFLAVLSLYLVDIFLDAHSRCNSVKRLLTYSIFLGAALWFTYETRLNGISILFACAMATLIYYIKNHSKFDIRSSLFLLTPYICFFLLKLISEAILAPATTNTSDIAGVTLDLVLGNLETYYYSIRAWLALIVDDIITNRLNTYLPLLTSTGADTYGVISTFCAAFDRVCVCVVLLITLFGIITDGIKRDLHLMLFAVVYLAVVCMLPYNQGIRYVYPVLVLIPVYFGCALNRCSVFVSSLFKGRYKRLRVGLSTVFAVGICSLILVSSARGIDYAHRNPEIIIPSGPQDFYRMYAYTPCAIETYNYINDNTPQDCVIGFIKPRALYLNTKRLSVRTDINGHSLDEVDFFLCCADVGEEQLTSEWRSKFTKVFSNTEFTLYKKINTRSASPP